MSESIEITISNQQIRKSISLDEVRKYLIGKLREEISAPNGNQTSYGYDVYLPKYMRNYIADVLNVRDTTAEGLLRPLSPLFLNAAWELSTRGIIRPGIVQYQAQSTEDGNAGNGYSFTPYGRQWLGETGHDDYIPTAPDAFVNLLTPYQSRFGSTFMQRSDEAIRCYGAHAYYACCAMIGAAAESIILKLAIARTGDEAKVTKEYQEHNGTSKTLNTLTHGQSGEIKRMIDNAFELMKYWRDAAAHADTTEITPNEAFTSLALLVRFARFSDEKYDDIISKTQP
ncbi:MAG: hypothetical protein JNK26_04080 [Candidatus Doudnabacteria bacterium]|nr:hypothetical protein [Candidatus Doudnabacteria bacterium]